MDRQAYVYMHSAIKKASLVTSPIRNHTKNKLTGKNCLNFCKPFYFLPRLHQSKRVFIVFISSISTDLPHVNSSFFLIPLYFQVYVEAVNEHGVSQPSQRVVFRTASVSQETSELEAAVDNYNETACCVAVKTTFTLFFRIFLSSYSKAYIF